MKSIKNYPFFCSWSGGKDSCLALYYAIQNGGMPKALLTMLREDGERSRSHGLPVNLIQRQAQNLNIPIFVKKTSWNDYEKVFLSTLHEFKKDGIEYGVFGDIDLEPHLEWVERVCSSAMIQPYEPLWKKARLDLLHDFFNLGFTARIVAVKQGVLDTSFLGQILNEQLVKEMEEIGIDASGEKGEYHTVVTDGPIFSSAIHLELKEQFVYEGYCFLDTSV
jgi:diphthine-ammonia ligase